MPIAIASWTQELVPGKSYSIDVPRDFRITNASLGEDLADAAGRSVVKLTVTEPDSDSEDDDESDDADEPSAPVKSILCALRAGAYEHAAMDVTFLEGQTVEFTVTGKNKVYLLGNYIDQGEDDMAPGMGMDDLDSDDEEGAFRLEDVSSDVEMDPAELAGLGESDSDDADRFEELPDEKPASASKKRPALEAPPASKKDKKQKGNDGKAAKPASTKPDSKPASKGKPQSQKPQSHGGKPQSQANGAGAGKPKSKGDGGKPKSKGGKK